MTFQQGVIPSCYDDEKTAVMHFCDSQRGMLALFDVYPLSLQVHGGLETELHPKHGFNIAPRCPRILLLVEINVQRRT